MSTKKQITVSDTHFKELCAMSDDLKLKRYDVIGLALGILAMLRANKAKSIKIVSSDGSEQEMILQVDISV